MEIGGGGGESTTQPLVQWSTSRSAQHKQEVKKPCKCQQSYFTDSCMILMYTAYRFHYVVFLVWLLGLYFQDHRL